MSSTVSHGGISKQLSGYITALRETAEPLRSGEQRELVNAIISRHGFKFANDMSLGEFISVNLGIYLAGESHEVQDLLEPTLKSVLNTEYQVLSSEVDKTGTKVVSYHTTDNATDGTYVPRYMHYIHLKDKEIVFSKKASLGAEISERVAKLLVGLFYTEAVTVSFRTLKDESSIIQSPLKTVTTALEEISSGVYGSDKYMIDEVRLTVGQAMLEYGKCAFLLARAVGPGIPALRKRKAAVYQRLVQINAGRTLSMDVALMSAVLGRINYLCTEDIDCLFSQRMKHHLRGGAPSVLASMLRMQVKLPVENYEPLYPLLPEGTPAEIERIFAEAKIQDGDEVLTPSSVLKAALRRSDLKSQLVALTERVHKFIPFAVFRAARGHLAGRAQALRQGISKEKLDSISETDLEGDILLLDFNMCRSCIRTSLEQASATTVKEALRNCAAGLRGSGVKQISQAEHVILAQIRKDILRI